MAKGGVGGRNVGLDLYEELNSLCIYLLVGCRIMELGILHGG